MNNKKIQIFSAIILLLVIYFIIINNKNIFNNAKNNIGIIQLKNKKSNSKAEEDLIKKDTLEEKDKFKNCLVKKSQCNTCIRKSKGIFICTKVYCKDEVFSCQKYKEKNNKF